MSRSIADLDRLLSRSAVVYRLMEVYADTMSERDFQELAELVDLEVEAATSDYD